MTTLSFAETATSAASHAPLISRSIVIGLFSLLHMALAAPAVALMVLAPIAEHAGRHRPFFTDVARTMTRFTVATFAASSVLAVFMIELFVGLFPLTNAWLFHQFRLPLYLGSAAFLLMTGALFGYFFWWDAIRRRSVPMHILLGAVAAACVVLWAAILDGMGSYMLTPSERTPDSTWGNLLNRTWIPLVLHRFGGDLATAGYLAAGYAVWMLGRRTGHPDEPYYLQFFKMGFGIGLLGLLLQPLTGLLYAVRIEQTVPHAYEQLVSGRYQAWMSLQFLLVGALFLGSHRILAAGAPASGRSRWREGVLIASAVLMVLFAGSPTIRRGFTFVLVGLTLWHVVAWRQELIAVGPQPFNRLSIRVTASLLAVLSLLTYLTMGVIRETARRPDLVRGHISLQDEARSPAAFRH